MTLMTGSGTPEPSGTGEPSGNAGTPSGPTWQDGLSDEFKGNASLSNFKDVNDLAKSYIHAQSMVGRDKVVLPTDKSTPEEISEFYSKLGMPSPEEYKIDGLEGEDEFSEQFKELMIKNNILPTQGKSLFDFIANTSIGEDDADDAEFSEMMQAELEDLREEWGDGFDENVGRAAGVIDKFGDEDLKTYLNESGLGNDPQLLRIFSAIGASLGTEGGFKGNTHTALNKDTAQARINEMYGDANSPMYNKSHPSHGETLKELEHLFTVVNA